jgi:hypothetical protein
MQNIISEGSTVAWAIGAFYEGALSTGAKQVDHIMPERTTLKGVKMHGVFRSGTLTGQSKVRATVYNSAGTLQGTYDWTIEPTSPSARSTTCGGLSSLRMVTPTSRCGSTDNRLRWSNGYGIPITHRQDQPCRPQSSCENGALDQDGAELHTFSSSNQADWDAAADLKVTWKIFGLDSDDTCSTKQVKLEYKLASTWIAFSGWPKNATGSSQTGTATASGVISKSQNLANVAATPVIQCFAARSTTAN